MIRKFLSSVAVALGLLACGTAFADEREDKAITTSLEVIGRTMPDLSFQGVDGKTLSLTQLRGKPVLLTLIYTGCADVCPAVIESLAPAVAVGEDALGKGTFNVVTIGFDSLPEALVQIRDGNLTATVEQFPGGQSRGAVQALVAYLRDGTKPEPLVLLTPKVITKDNLDEAERIGETN